MNSKNQLTFLAVFTLFGFSGIAYFILSFSDTFSYSNIFKTNSLLIDLLIGFVGGGVLSGLGWWLLQLPVLKKVGAHYRQLFSTIQLTWADVLFYSFCAGVGDEILFRGAIQPYLGVWITAVLFVLLHGYISVKNLPRTLYGVFLIGVAVGFGYAYEYRSIYTAMAAHFMYDVVMFSYLKKTS